MNMRPGLVFHNDRSNFSFSSDQNCTVVSPARYVQQTCVNWRKYLLKEGQRFTLAKVFDIWYRHTGAATNIVYR